jgi:CYTH domain-containing protein
VEYLNYLGRKITNDARYTSEIIPRIAMAKAAFSNTKSLLPEKWT